VGGELIKLFVARKGDKKVRLSKEWNKNIFSGKEIDRVGLSFNGKEHFLPKEKIDELGKIIGYFYLKVGYSNLIMNANKIMVKTDALSEEEIGYVNEKGDCWIVSVNQRTGKVEYRKDNIHRMGLNVDIQPINKEMLK